MSLVLVDVENVSYAYPSSPEMALKGVDLKIKPGEFLVVCGGSGSGKSTLLRAIAGLLQDFYGGKLSGSITVGGREVREMTRRERARLISMVFQSPDNQMVTGRVDREIAFGLQNLGLDPELMARRVVEAAAALNITPHLERPTSELSGGTAQRVAIAAALALKAPLMLLDEPASDLDPAAASELFSALRQLNQETGVTVVLAEQRLEKCFHLADRVVVLDEGRIVADGHPRQVACKMDGRYLPPVSACFARAGYGVTPLTVKEGKELIGPPSGPLFAAGKEEGERDVVSSLPVLRVRGLWYTYPGGTEALKGIDLDVYPGEIWAVLGENGAGKSTLLASLAGLLVPGRGEVRVLGQDTRRQTVEERAGLVGYLSQYPDEYLFAASVRAEVEFSLACVKPKDSGEVDEVLSRLGLSHISSSDPRDLSVGERQRVALAATLVTRPRLLLLDEPTRGLDAVKKWELGQILLEMAGEGTAVVMVTHDVEFAAEFADKAAILSRGRWVARGNSREILSGGTYYSPQVNKLLSEYDPRVMKVEEAAGLLAEIKRVQRQELK